MTRQPNTTRAALAAAAVVAIAALALTARQHPGRAARAAAPNARPHAGVFDVRDFGATPDDNTADSDPINAAIRGAANAGGGVVYLPRGRYVLNGPLNLRQCSGVTLRGDGPATAVGSAGYAGPLISVGLPLGATPPEHRPPSPLQTTTPKRSISTLGTQALAITGHPLQLGRCTNQATGQPDYWSGTAAFTWDFAVGASNPANWATLFGFADANGLPAPWLVRYVDGAIVIDLRCVGDAQFHRIEIPVPAGQPLSRITAQFDPQSGRVAAWLGGRLATTQFAPGWDGPKPPGPLVPHDGLTPFLIGYAAPRMDARAGGITDLQLHALRVSRGLVYQWDGAAPGAQTFAAAPTTPLNDDTQFFTVNDQLLPGRPLVALLPMDPEAEGSPWVSCSTYRGQGLLAWLPPITWWETTNVAVEDLTLDGATQPCVLVGACGRLSLRRLACSGASQALGSLPLMVSYPIYLDACDFSGWDAPIVSFWQQIESRGLVLSGCGRNGIRTAGGDALWDGLKVWRLGPYCESVFRHTGGDDGLNQEYRHVEVDDEDSAPRDAFLDVEQGWYQTGRVTVAGLFVSALAPGSALVRLTGHGTNNGHAPYHVDLRGLGTFGECPVALRVVGPPSFHGTIDVSETSPAAVQADPGAAAAITVVKTTTLYQPAPAAP